MAINVRCSECGKPYSVKEEIAGKTIRCKVCSKPIPVPLELRDEDQFESDDFLNSLSDAVDDSHAASSLPPKTGNPVGTRKKSRKTSGNFNLAGMGLPQWVFGVCIAIGLVLLGLTLRHDAIFFGFLVFFGGICFAAAITKTEPEHRWSIPAVSVISGYTIMLAFAAVIVRNEMIVLDLVIMGIGLAVLVTAPGLLGFSILFGISLLQLMYLAGTFGNIEVVLMDRSIRRCHQLVSSTAMLYLVSGYLYYLWNTYGAPDSKESYT